MGRELAAATLAPAMMKARTKTSKTNQEVGPRSCLLLFSKYLWNRSTKEEANKWRDYLTADWKEGTYIVEPSDIKIRNYDKNERTCHR